MKVALIVLPVVCWAVVLHSAEEKKAVISSDTAIVNGECIYASGLQPIGLDVAVSSAAVLRVVSQKAPENNATLKFENGKARVILDYSKHVPISVPDDVSMFLGAPTSDERPVFHIKVYPVFVQMFPGSNWTRRFENLLLDGKEGTRTGCANIQYKIRPWHDGLSQHVDLMFVPTVFGYAKVKVTGAVTKAEGEVRLEATSDTQDMTAMTAVLKTTRPSEASRRLPVYIIAIEQLAKTVPATEAQAKTIAEALKEIYPSPRDAYTTERVGKLQALLIARYVPYIAEALRGLDKLWKRELLELCVKDGEVEQFIMSLAFESVKHVPLTPR
jgi:hypothetical protein